MNKDVPVPVKIGWLSKENQTAFLWVKLHRHRFVSVDSKELVIAHDTNTSDNRKVIPLQSIVSVTGSSVPEQISVNVGHRVYNLTATSVIEAIDWKDAILSAKNALLKQQEEIIKAAMNNKRQNELKLAVSEANISSEALNFVTDSPILNMLQCLTRDGPSSHRAAEQFFKSLKYYQAKQRNMMAKTMGKSMAIWLLSDGDSRASESLTKSEVLHIWVRVALARELNTSCKFESQVGLGLADTVSVASGSSISSHATGATGATGASRGVVRRGSGATFARKSSIMPFRADSPECLFLSSLTHAISTQSFLLCHLLHPAMHPLSARPEGYIFSPPGMAAINQSAGMASGKAGPMKPAASASNNSSETSFHGRLLRAFSRLTGGGGGSGGGGSPSAPGSGGVNTVSDAPPALSAAEIRANIYELLLCVLTRLMDLQSSGALPATVVQLVHTIKEVTISAVPSPPTENDGDNGGEFKMNEQQQQQAAAFSSPPPAAGKQRRGSGAGGVVSSPDTPQSPEDAAADAADLHEQMLRFEYSRYYTSCTALLFLRLICPAIITPDWMPRINNVATDVAVDTEPVVNQYAIPSGAVIVAAHSLANMRANPKSGDRVASITYNNNNSSAAKDVHGNISLFTAPSANLRGIAFANVLPSAEASSTAAAAAGSQQKEALFAAAEEVQSAVPIEEATKLVDAFTVVFESTCRPSLPSDCPDYSLDLMSMPVRRALAEVAKALLHISNIACLSTDEMEGMAVDAIIRQNVSTGLLDKDRFDSHVLTPYERDVVETQLSLATMIKSFYEKVGDIPAGVW